jgi:hypothetical protein
MTPVRIAVAVGVVGIVGYCLVKSIGKPARAAEAVRVEPFSEDESLHRYANNQPRHWRHLLVKR